MMGFTKKHKIKRKVIMYFDFLVKYCSFDEKIEEISY